MSSFSLNGDLPPAIADAVAAAPPVNDKIDLATNGTQLIGTVGEVRFLADVDSNKIAEYYCTNASGERLPSFVLREHQQSDESCYLCYIDTNGNKCGCHAISCWFPV